MLEKVQQRKGRFPLTEVLAQGLAQTVAVGCIVEGIVSQLEGDAESLAESEKRVLLVINPRPRRLRRFCMRPQSIRLFCVR